ncbi:MAG: MMPL family transporter [Nitrospinae bacterium]|nr:MMPL family transporter [Nitrospinota bacterium]
MNGAAMDWKRRLARLLVEHTGVVLVVMLLFTGVFAYFLVTGLKLKIILEEMVPQGHPYVKIYNTYAPIFGGANTTLVEVRTAKGNIYHPQFLQRFRKITEDLYYYPDTNRFSMQSIALKKTKAITGEAGTIRIEAIMWPDIPQDAEGLRQLRINAKDLYGGQLVSADDTAAMIILDFKPDMDFEKFHRFFEQLREREEAGGAITVHGVGRPLLLGTIYAHVPQMMGIFVLTFLLIVGVVYVYYASFVGVMIPVIKAVMTTIWGFGFVSITGYNVNPLMLLLPFFVFATILSHSIQITNRFYEEYARLKDFKLALEETITALLKPSFSAIFTDAMGFTVLYLAAIPTIRILSILCTAWLLSITLAVTFSAATFFYVPLPETLEARGKKWLHKFSLLADLDYQRWGKTVLVVVAGIFVIGAVLVPRVVIGDPHPGSPILWPTARYNRDNGEINQRFGRLGTDTLQLFVDGPEGTMAEPRVYQTIEDLSRVLHQRHEEVSGVQSLVPLVKKVHAVVFEGDPSYEFIPASRDTIAMDLYFFRSRSDPGDFDVFTDGSWLKGNVVYFLSDHKNATLRKIAADMEEFFAGEPGEPKETVRHLFPGGLGGLTLATDQVIERSGYWTIAAILGVIVVTVYISYRSIAACLLLAVVLLGAQLIAQAYMYFMGIGMNLSTLPVAAVGMGRGVDYGIYVMDRLQEEYRRLGNLPLAIRRMLESSGTAIVLTASTMIVPLIPWYFLSGLRFQAEMGFLLAIVLFFNMLGAIVFIPAAVTVFKPKSLLGKRAVDTKMPDHPPSPPPYEGGAGGGIPLKRKGLT